MTIHGDWSGVYVASDCRASSFDKLRMRSLAMTKWERLAMRGLAGLFANLN